MSSFAYRVSIIIPVYNVEKYIDRCIASLREQTIPQADMEILFIDDGSPDSCPQMCDAYAERYDNVSVVHQSNKGLSGARNAGIDHARGKYLLYLDPDDTLSPETVLSVVDFFDNHYDEIDLVTYPILKLSNGVETKPHYRYKTLSKTGVYDLTDPKNTYAAVTLVVSCVKNLPKSDRVYFDEGTIGHEDQRYCTEVILKKLKVGFVKEAQYIYEPNPNGLVSTNFHAYYLFESTMDFWETEFGRYEGAVPKYLQALYVSDIGWKTRSDILLPYHYEKEEFERAERRLLRLLDRCDTDVILNHPGVTDWIKGYILQKSSGRNVAVLVNKNKQALIADDVLFQAKSAVRAVILKTRVFEDGLGFRVLLRDMLFAYASGRPKVYACFADPESPCGVMEEVELSLYSSAYDYMNAKARTTKSYTFDFFLSKKEHRLVTFVAEVNGERFNLSYLKQPAAIFSGKPKRTKVLFGDYECSFENNGFVMRDGDSSKYVREYRKSLSFFAEKPKLSRSERFAIKYLGKKAPTPLDGYKLSLPIWLYSDCHGVEKNEAYLQFKHDNQIDDGIQRFYVVNDDIDRSHLFTKEELANQVIRFGSPEHKIYYLAADKIITAYAERVNYCPFDNAEFKKRGGFFHAEIVYLQHGVLHAHTPWKYSIDRLGIDREVVSSEFEVENLKRNYCFKDSELIKAGMPRYDFMDSSAVSSNKILLAPSWRKYMVAQKPDGQWLPREKAFTASSFYRETKAFLESPRLHSLLEEYNYTLDFKPHPILAELYLDKFDLGYDRIKVVSGSVKEADYKIFVSDFSSYRFDFVYLKRAIMYFFPDEAEFRSGMCDYRVTDLPIDGMFGHLTKTADEAIDELERLIKRGGKPDDKFVRQMDGFFFYEDSCQRDRIYDALVDVEQARRVF